MRNETVLGLAVLAIGLLAPGCFLRLPPTVHGDWDEELKILHEEQDILPLKLKCETNLLESVMRAGPLTVVDRRERDYDFLVRAEMKTQEYLSPLAYIGLVTLYLIPGKSTTEVLLQVDLYDKQDRLVKRYRRGASYNTWIGWIYLFWSIPVTDWSPEETLEKDMTRDIVREMFQKDYGSFTEWASSGG